MSEQLYFIDAGEGQVEIVDSGYFERYGKYFLAELLERVQRETQEEK